MPKALNMHCCKVLSTTAPLTSRSCDLASSDKFERIIAALPHSTSCFQVFRTVPIVEYSHSCPFCTMPSNCRGNLPSYAYSTRCDIESKFSIWHVMCLPIIGAQHLD